MHEFLQTLAHAEGVIAADAEATEGLGTTLGQLLPPNTVLALHGNLGAGKTTFVRGLARAWAIEEAVTSPTFNLYTIYQGERQLLHLDAYRLHSSEDVDALMIEDFLEPPWAFVVEWPERIADSLPADAWHLFFSIGPDHSRRLRLELPS
jgi:tRNA threonylcarbamoyladenosine biosynthesis protein TsaE